MSKKTDKRSFSPQLRKTLTLVLPLTVGGVIVDQLTKIWAANCLKGHAPINLIPGIIRLHYAENTGAAFSMLSGQRFFFIALTLIVLAAVGYVLWKGHLRNNFGYCAIALCVSGTIGNFIDRLLYGYVVDMFEPTFISFAIFNVADICLTIGGILLAVYLLFLHENHRPSKEAQPHSESTGTDGNV